MLKSLPKPFIALGTGLRRNPEIFSDTPCLPPEFDTPKAEVLLRLAVAAEYSRAPVTPQYIRAFRRGTEPGAHRRIAGD